MVDWQRRGWSAFLGDLGFGELMVIFVVALVVFGPQKLPELGRTLGTTLRELRQAARSLGEEVARAAGDEVEGSRKGAPRSAPRPPAAPAPRPQPEPQQPPH